MSVLTFWSRRRKRFIRAHITSLLLSLRSPRRIEVDESVMAAVLVRCLECCPLRSLRLCSAPPECHIERNRQAERSGYGKHALIVGELSARFIHLPHRLCYLLSQIDMFHWRCDLHLLRYLSTAIEWRGDDFETPHRLPRCLRLPRIHSNTRVPTMVPCHFCITRLFRVEFHGAVHESTCD